MCVLCISSVPGYDMWKWAQLNQPISLTRPRKSPRVTARVRGHVTLRKKLEIVQRSLRYHKWIHIVPRNTGPYNSTKPTCFRKMQFYWDTLYREIHTGSGQLCHMPFFLRLWWSESFFLVRCAFSNLQQQLYTGGQKKLNYYFCPLFVKGD